jgi:hypothetical protein
MTNEEYLQGQLDRKPDDHKARRKLADLLAEKGDVRADGYRYLADNRIVLCDQVCVGPGQFQWVPHQFATAFVDDGSGDDNDLPPALFDEIVGGTLCGRGTSVTFPNRRAAEDAVARAFAKIPEPHRKRLLPLTERRA